MMFTSSNMALIGLGLFSTLSMASPTPVSDNVARACTTILPSSYQIISESSPTTSFPQNRQFNVSQAAGGVNSIDTLVHFTNIPSGSYGCQLGFSFTYEYDIKSSGSAAVNTYSLSKDITPSSTYSTYFPNGGKGAPVGSTLFGTTTINGQKQIINSEVCANSLSFLFEIASDTQAGSVSYVDAGDNLSGIGGLFMTYNC